MRTSPSALRIARGAKVFLFRRIRAITSDFAPQHRVMNAGRCTVSLASVAWDTAFFTSFLYHDYIILQAIRLRDCVALFPLIESLKSKPTIRI